MAQPKKQNTAQKWTLKKQIFELPEQKLKVTILKMLNKLKENIDK